jgi:hypothetical protein
MGLALNLGDRKDVAAAVDTLTIPSSGVVADIGLEAVSVSGSCSIARTPAAKSTGSRCRQ